MPYRGYWVKAKQSGTLILGGGDGKHSMAATRLETLNDLTARAVTVTLNDAAGVRQDLYLISASGVSGGDDLSRFEMPPPPPGDVGDMRFISGRQFELLPLTSKAREYTILLSAGVAFPLLIERSDASIPGPPTISLKAGSTIMPLKNNSPVAAETRCERLTLIVQGEPIAAVPKKFRLDQNYPNPFNPVTEIPYALPVRAHVRIDVYTILGQLACTLIDTDQDPGSRTVQWNAAGCPSGIYYCRMDAAGVFDPSKKYSQVIKMAVVK